MDFLIPYLIFCLTTGITSLIFLFSPVMQDLKFEQPLHELVQVPILSYFVFCCVAMVAAPAVFLAIVIPSTGDKFRTSLAKSLRNV